MNQTLGARLSPDLTGANVEDAGEHNRAVVLRCIHRQAPISRAETRPDLTLVSRPRASRLLKGETRYRGDNATVVITALTKCSWDTG